LQATGYLYGSLKNGKIVKYVEMEQKVFQGWSIEQKAAKVDCNKVSHRGTKTEVGNLH
jgi:hypothetical protein